MGDLLARRLETTIRPTVPGRSVAPMTAAERGKNSDSSPARAGGATRENLSTWDGKEGIVPWLTEILPLTRMVYFFTTLATRGQRCNLHDTHAGTVFYFRQ